MQHMTHVGLNPADATIHHPVCPLHHFVQRNFTKKKERLLVPIATYILWMKYLDIYNPFCLCTSVTFNILPGCWMITASHDRLKNKRMCRSCGSVACIGWHLKLMDHQTRAAGLNQIQLPSVKCGQTNGQRGTNILNKHRWETVGYAFYSCLFLT